MQKYDLGKNRENFCAIYGEFAWFFQTFFSYTSITIDRIRILPRAVVFNVYQHDVWITRLCKNCAIHHGKQWIYSKLRKYIVESKWDNVIVHVILHAIWREKKTYLTFIFHTNNCSSFLWCYKLWIYFVPVCFVLKVGRNSYCVALCLCAYYSK